MMTFPDYEFARFYWYIAENAYNEQLSYGLQYIEKTPENFYRNTRK